MSNLPGFLGAAALIMGGAMVYAPMAPEEPRPPEVVAEAPPAPEPAKPAGEGAPQGG